MRDGIPATQWLVFTSQVVNGTHWHRFKTRRLQRQFARGQHGYCFDLRRSRH